MKKSLTMIAMILALGGCAAKGPKASASAAPAPAAAPARPTPSEAPAPPAVAVDPNLPLSSQVELLRSDLRLMKKEIVAQAMGLSEPEAAAFWPVYNDYQTARSKIFDRRVEVIKLYAETYASMTAADATKITNTNFALDEAVRKLQESTFKRLSKATSAQTAARWVQIDRQLEAILTLQVSQNLPLMPRPVAKVN
jgi:PBP1b-binding outer membrane lipoprotein LpoB